MLFLIIKFCPGHNMISHGKRSLYGGVQCKRPINLDKHILRVLRFFVRKYSVNPLPDGKILGFPKLKAFADDKSHVTQSIKVVFHRVENIVGKEKMLVLCLGELKGHNLCLKTFD